jgi:hypothetical protein
MCISVWREEYEVVQNPPFDQYEKEAQERLFLDISSISSISELSSYWTGRDLSTACGIRVSVENNLILLLFTDRNGEGVDGCFARPSEITFYKGPDLLGLSSINIGDKFRFSFKAEFKYT